MDLRQLEVFRCVYEERSFSKAAQRLHLTQPTVSGHIKSLEQFFGTALLDRLGRETVPTRAGEVLYRQSREMLEMKRSVVDGMNRFLGRLEGELRLGASTIPGEYLLPGLIGRFHRSHPGIRITLEISDSEAVAREVGEGRAEIGFAGARAEDRELEFASFAHDRLILAVPATPEWRQAPEVSLAQLRGEPLVIREPGSGTRSMLEHKLAELGHSLDDFNVVAELGSTASIKEAIREGLGWSVLSDLAIRTDLRAGLITTLPLEGIEPWEREFFIVLSRRRSRSPACEAFLEVAAAAGLHRETAGSEETPAPAALRHREPSGAATPSTRAARRHG